jgi:hypothetical protein
MLSWFGAPVIPFGASVFMDLKSLNNLLLHALDMRKIEISMIGRL